MTPFEACLLKLAEVAQDEAQRALNRLEWLETGRPSNEQLARGALIGSIVGPVASGASKLISTGKFHTPREVAGQVAGGLITGTALPFMKHHLDTHAERKKLQDYVSGHHGRLAKRIEQKLEPV